MNVSYYYSEQHITETYKDVIMQRFEGPEPDQVDINSRKHNTQGDNR